MLDCFMPIIIGCGPEGAITSIFLSKNKISHLVLEKETFPCDKICGDACSDKTSFVFRKADPALLTDVFQMTIVFCQVRVLFFRHLMVKV